LSQVRAGFEHISYIRNANNVKVSSEKMSDRKKSAIIVYWLDAFESKLEKVNKAYQAIQNGMKKNVKSIVFFLRFIQLVLNDGIDCIENDARYTNNRKQDH
jgi:tRNA 2-selenouridine synthase SelU